jgi:hypothetical protein
MRILLAILAVPFALFPAVNPQKPAPNPITPTMLAPIEQVARQLAKGGREREMNDLLTALEKLGQPQANHEKVSKSCKEDLAKAKVAIDSLPAGAKQLRVTAKQLAVVMKSLQGEEQLELARNILRIDGEVAEAHELLGHEKVGKSWVPSEEKELRERRGTIFEKVQEAKKLEVEITEGEVDDPVIKTACGVQATFARYGPVELRSNFSQEKTTRMLREILRALALSNYLMTGSLKVPVPAKSATIKSLYALIDSREQYKAYAEECAKNGSMPAEEAELLENSGTFNHKNGTYVSLAQWEAATNSNLFVQLNRVAKRGVMAPVVAGHLNWVTLTCFGSLLPSLFTKDSGSAPVSTTRVEESEDEKRERSERQRLAKGGIAGSRSWMAFLAERGEDPPLSGSFVDQIGLLSGDNLHKWTSIVDFMQEANLLESTYKSLRRPKDGPVYQQYADALGMSVGELESRWRRWILGSRPGVAERIDKENLNAWPKDALDVLAYMNDLREKAFKGNIEGLWKLKFDPELSEGCALHAHYLTLHPEQNKWPDAHEEYQDKEGFTVEGAWSGTHSVIIWGDMRDYIDSIDGWMGTYYHRLPLIDPGLLRIGWGSENEYVVMDTGSLSAPYEKPFVVVWPHDGMKDVPTYFFGNEYPDPVPEAVPNGEAEQEVLGFPITLQTNPYNNDGVIDIVMKLFDKKAKAEVECWFSTPSDPTNPESPTPGSWCLMPKTKLKPNTEYRVQADWSRGSLQTKTAVQKSMEWTFRTK